ncbi:putative leucine-rich repeat flightless-interacting protein 2 isoform X1 [Daphnia sinensis]|uniref:Leucine-rich repeat flightless-interacting protein 2 isoform X1 n=1 Tax=Daphnia sinensis TaxID=1820382 RepID=A0AAD5L254_9CRUS|nr:putative leucine-rich repeat flightless-interacting protein 2 isoform X1 [Daphnia sinensis]
MENVGNIGSRKRVAGNHYSAEEQALDQIAKEAESRLVARRLARAEAREIRMRELEKQQKEMEENADRQFTAESGMETNPKLQVNRTVSTGVTSAANRPMLGTTASFQSSRRGSEDSIDDIPGQSMTLRDLRQELKELEEKFRKAMVQNAQSDNEKASLMYQVELLKDKIEDMDEAYALLQKEHKDKHRECEDSKRDMARIQQELNYNKYLLEERDKMIQEHGLVMIGDDEEGDDNGSTAVTNTVKKVLVSADVAALLGKAGDGSLDVRIRRLTEEKNELCDQLRRLKLDLEEERTKSLYRERLLSGSAVGLTNGPAGDLTEWQKEAVTKQVNDYKMKLQKADQEIATLQATVARLETQVTRFRVAAETLEKSEDELKAEKRKLQRELRESQTKMEELETSHNHLQRRLDKLKTAKSALLKEI